MFVVLLMQGLVEEARKDKGYRRRCCAINHRVYCRPREYHIVYEIAERTNHQGLRNEIVNGKVSPRPQRFVFHGAQVAKFLMRPLSVYKYK